MACYFETGYILFCVSLPYVMHVKPVRYRIGGGKMILVVQKFLTGFWLGSCWLERQQHSKAVVKKQTCCLVMPACKVFLF